MGVPGAVGNPTEDRHDLPWINAPADGHREIAIVGEDPVGRRQRKSCAHLGSFVADIRPPEAQLALALEIEALLVQTTTDHHHAIAVAQLLAWHAGPPP